MGEYVIVAETGSDILQESVDRYGIYLVPMHVTMGGKDYDDRTFPAQQIFDYYERTRDLPHTSGSNPDDFARVFDLVHEQHPHAHIIYLAYSAITTVSMGSALIAAQGRDYITAIDTKSVSAGQALIIERVATYIEENPDVSVEAIIAYVGELRASIRMAFAPGGVEFLRAGGRVTNKAAIAAQLLRIHPVIEIEDGQLVATDKLRGAMRRVAPHLLERFVEREPMDLGTIVLIRAALPESIQEKVEGMARGYGFRQVRWLDTGNVISSHCGPDTFGVAAFADVSR